MFALTGRIRTPIRALLPIFLLAASGCYFPTRYVSLTNGEPQRQVLKEVSSLTRGGKYVFTAWNLRTIGSPFSPEAAEVGIVVCVVTDDILTWGSLNIGEGCQVYVVECLQPDSRLWRGTSGRVKFAMEKISGIHLGLDVTMQGVGGEERSAMLTGHIDFEEQFLLLWQAPPHMAWAIEDAIPSLKVRPRSK